MIFFVCTEHSGNVWEHWLVGIMAVGSQRAEKVELEVIKCKLISPPFGSTKSAFKSTRRWVEGGKRWASCPQRVPVLEGAREGGSAVTSEVARNGAAEREPRMGGERTLHGQSGQLHPGSEFLLRDVSEERDQRGPLGWRRARGSFASSGLA